MVGKQLRKFPELDINIIPLSHLPNFHQKKLASYKNDNFHKRQFVKILYPLRGREGSGGFAQFCCWKEVVMGLGEGGGGTKSRKEEIVKKTPNQKTSTFHHKTKIKNWEVIFSHNFFSKTYVLLKQHYQKHKNKHPEAHKTQTLFDNFSNHTLQTGSHTCVFRGSLFPTDLPANKKGDEEFASAPFASAHARSKVHRRCRSHL